MVMSKRSVSNAKPENIKIGLIGFHGSGKTAILVKFYTSRYIVEYSQSIFDTVQKVECIDGHVYNISIRDTIDTDDNYSENIFGWADIILDIFSITSRSSYYRAIEIGRLNMSYSLNTLRKHGHKSGSNHSTKNSVANSKRCPFWLLIGNKSDLADLRLVQHDEAQKVAETMQMPYLECSVILEYDSIHNMFHESIRMFQKSTSSTTSSSSSRSSSSLSTSYTNLTSIAYQKATSFATKIPESLPQLTRFLMSNHSNNSNSSNNSNNSNNKTLSLNNSNRSSKNSCHGSDGNSPRDTNSNATKPPYPNNVTKKNSLAFRFFSKKAK